MREDLIHYKTMKKYTSEEILIQSLSDIYEIDILKDALNLLPLKESVKRLENMSQSHVNRYRKNNEVFYNIRSRMSLDKISHMNREFSCKEIESITIYENTAYIMERGCIVDVAYLNEYNSISLIKAVKAYMSNQLKYNNKIVKHNAEVMKRREKGLTGRIKKYKITPLYIVIFYNRYCSQLCNIYNIPEVNLDYKFRLRKK